MQFRACPWSGMPLGCVARRCVNSRYPRFALLQNERGTELPSVAQLRKAPPATLRGASGGLVGRSLLHSSRLPAVPLLVGPLNARSLLYRCMLGRCCTAPSLCRNRNFGRAWAFAWTRTRAAFPPLHASSQRPRGAAVRPLPLAVPRWRCATRCSRLERPGPEGWRSLHCTTRGSQD